jgi:hypothetical protein
VSDIAELQRLLGSVKREGSLVNAFIDALGHAREYEGITREEALGATRRFAELVEKSAADTETEIS